MKVSPAPIVSSPNPYSVIIADDHQMFRETLMRYLSSIEGIEVIAGVADGEAAISAVLKHRPTVLVVDVTMPQCSGLDVVRSLVGSQVKTRFLMLTMHDNPSMRRAARAAGAHDYITKTASTEELVAAISRVAQGTSAAFYSQESESDNSADAERLHMVAVVDSGLSKRERQVLTGIAEGYTSKEIGEQLCISPGTVDNYRARIGAKLGVKGRAAMVQAALRAGLVL